MLNRSLEVNKTKKLNHILIERNFSFDDKYNKKDELFDQTKNNHLFNEQLEVDNIKLPEYEQKMPPRFGYHVPKENTKKYVMNNRFDFDEDSGDEDIYDGDICDGDSGVFSSKVNSKNSKKSGLSNIKAYSIETNNFELSQNKTDDKTEYYKNLQKHIGNKISLSETEIINKIINEQTFKLFNNLNKYVNKKFTISPYNLIVILAALYKIVNNTSFKNYFKYSKSITEDGIININKNLNKTAIINYNTLFVNQDKFNMTNINDLEKFLHIEKLDMKDMDKYGERMLTFYTKKIQKTIQHELSKMNNSENINSKPTASSLLNSCKEPNESHVKLEYFDSLLTSTHLNRNTEILGLNIYFIKSYWKNSMMNIGDSVFFNHVGNGIVESKVKMLASYNKVQPYCETDKYEMIELELYDSISSSPIGDTNIYGDVNLTPKSGLTGIRVGIILLKNNTDSISGEDIMDSIGNLKDKTFGIINIPVFRFVSSIKMDKLLIKMGFGTIFEKLTIASTEKTTKLNYVLHRNIIDIDNFNKYSGDTKKKFGKDFIANRPFIYYIRYVPTNTFTLIGYFTSL